jgi:hypothetical protein
MTHDRLNRWILRPRAMRLGADRPGFDDYFEGVEVEYSIRKAFQ